MILKTTVKRFHQLFESSINDELQLILNIAIDEGIEVSISRACNRLGLPTAMLADMGFIHNQIDRVTLIADNGDLDMVVVKNVLSRVKQLVDIGVAYSARGREKFADRTTEVDRWFIHDDLDVIPDDVTYVRFFVLPRIGEFHFEQGGYYSIVNDVFYSYQKNRYTLWSCTPPNQKNGAIVEYGNDGEHILSVKFDNKHYKVGGSAGDDIHKMYTGMNITSIKYEFNNNIPLAEFNRLLKKYSYKYIIELE